MKAPDIKLPVRLVLPHLVISSLRWLLSPQNGTGPKGVHVPLVSQLSSTIESDLYHTLQYSLKVYFGYNRLKYIKINFTCFLKRPLYCDNRLYLWFIYVYCDWVCASLSTGVANLVADNGEV